MKNTAPYRTAALLVFSSIATLSAQNIDKADRKSDVRPLAVDDLEGRDSKGFDSASLPGSYRVPAVKAAANLPEGREAFVSQDSATLGSSQGSQRSVENVVDLSPLRDSSPLAKNSAAGLALISATYRAPGETDAKADCPAIGLSVQQRIKQDSARLLEIVETEVRANPSCACEIVKASLKASNADAGLTADIVEVASITAPEMMRIVSQCAIAVVPESLSTVQAVLAKLDPNSGEGSSSKSSKGGKDGLSSKDSKGHEVLGRGDTAPPPVPQPDPGNPLNLTPQSGPPLIPPPLITEVVTDVNSTEN